MPAVHESELLLLRAAPPQDMDGVAIQDVTESIYSIIICCDQVGIVLYLFITHPSSRLVLAVNGPLSPIV